MRKRSVRLNLEEGDDPSLGKALQDKADLLYAKLLERGQVFSLPEEQALFLDRLRCYVKDYPGLNVSSDLDNLFAMITETITQLRILKITQETGAPLPEAYTDSIARWNKIAISLAGRRIDRKKMPDKQEDFRRIMEEVFSNNASVLTEQDKGMAEEEAQFDQEKAKRDEALGLKHE
ncbi:hypothetical protein HY496_00125 [Candidatus Woesearchaeota archaeon]|nr:hypothetical protein [Candidatus Woesearchaeota archaeon]